MLDSISVTSNGGGAPSTTVGLDSPPSRSTTSKRPSATCTPPSDLTPPRPALGDVFAGISILLAKSTAYILFFAWKPATARLMAIYETSSQRVICNTMEQARQRAATRPRCAGLGRSTQQTAQVFLPRSKGLPLSHPCSPSLGSSLDVLSTASRSGGGVWGKRLGQRLTAIGDHGSLGKASSTWKTYLVP